MGIRLRTALYIIGLGIGIGVVASIIFPADTKLSYDNIIRSTVFLTCTTPGTVSMGTGVVLKGQHRIITAGHMLSDVNTVDVTEITGKQYLLADWHKQVVRDIGYITFTNSVEVGVEISTAAVSIGEPVWLCGHMGGDTYAWSLTHGIVSRVVNDEIYTDCAACPGCSGGGLFTRDGKLIGIIVQGIPGVITKALRVNP